MKYLLLITAILGISCLNPLSDEFIDEINQKSTTWKAGRNFDQNVDIDNIRELMGVLPDSIDHLLPERKQISAIMSLPEYFDAREKWPNCPTISEIPDQGSCGSCWAFTAAGAISDRVCIDSNASIHIHFSPQHLLSCCPNCGAGCTGGFPGAAWNYWVFNGLVSGGPYGTNEGCQPYDIEPCQHHVNGTRKPCDKFVHKTPKCQAKCTNPNYTVDYEADNHFGKIAYSVASSPMEIQRDLFNYGPSGASFKVYEDFLHYRSGVYQFVAGKFIGNHAVRLIGWGVEDDTPYWLIANSWNTDWGDNGFFKIIRGEDHLGIENQVEAGLP